MEPTLETINGGGRLNQIIDIEESSLAQSQFNDLSIKEDACVKRLECITNIRQQVANKLNIAVGTLTGCSKCFSEKGYVVRLKSETDQIVILGRPRS